MKKIIFISVIVATNALYSINIENATCKMFENGKLFRTEINAVSLYATKNDALLKSHKGEILKLQSTEKNIYLSIETGIILKINTESKSFVYEDLTNKIRTECTSKPLDSKI